MSLKSSGQKQKFPANWKKKRMVITKEPNEMHGVFELKAIPRQFADDELQIKFQNFLLECDSNRIMVAYLDLLDDLKSEKIFLSDDWSPYTDTSRFVVFSDGSIRWE